MVPKSWTIQALLFKPGFELSQTVDFQKGVTFWNNSINLCPSNLTPYFATTGNVVPKSWAIRLCPSSQVLSYRKPWTSKKESHYEITHSVSFYCGSQLMLSFPVTATQTCDGIFFLGNRWKKKPELPLVLLDPYFVTVMRKERGDNLIRQTRSKIIQMKGCLPWPQCWLPFLF